ncbi:predicted protein [Plenodomus lingam JN3]|uniref:Predicted protein n=1 Tax=Leptosphaeria maculans (strain JN3 / isolate v23.1.3 / race Av1-4-5-6-7-8) TaxID=985895 RepID=E5R5H0_LEPMJ|nr:predicted protein [Plenodomus lingam JN3]CBX92140.1 predicted protein [Plenodomus lingam JN3]
MPAYHINSISYKIFTEALSRYPATVPDKLRNLDTQRYETIPATAICEDGSANLTKSMVETLVEWKLVLNITTAAAEVAKTAAVADVQAGLKLLTQLRGVGPATASLLLSVLRPADVPFFSDELFRWCVWGEADGEAGWRRGIKYTAKEYGVVVEKVGELRRRLGVQRVQAVHVEKVAWVLGKERVDVGGGVGEEGGDDGFGGEELAGEGKRAVADEVGGKRRMQDLEDENAPPKKMPKKTVKSKEVSVGTRKSTRMKK